MTGRVRPARPFSPLALGIAVLGIWWLVAHNSGSGWVQAIGDAVFGVLLIGLVGPAVVVARARVQIVWAPSDGTAGVPLEITLRSSSRVRLRAIDPEGPEGFAGPVRRRKAEVTGITLVPRHRGVYEGVTVEIATAAPFGLQWWCRRSSLVLPVRLYVAPRLGRPIPVDVRDRDHSEESARRRPASAGDPRGVRPYRSGDNRRYVHWPATAHTGELMVRELERPSAAPVTVTVSLPADDEEAERISEQALGTVVQLLDRGNRVLLATTEPAGPLVAPVEDRLLAGRRLAGAVCDTIRPRDPTDPFGVGISP